MEKLKNKMTPSSRLICYELNCNASAKNYRRMKINLSSQHKDKQFGKESTFRKPLIILKLFD